MRTALILAASLVFATTAQAQTNAAMTKPTAPVAKPKAAMSGAPDIKVVPPKAAPKKVAATGGRMVTTKTKSGKTITYDCSKKGNMTKTACKA